VPSAFDTEADIENMTDEEVEQAAKGEAADEKVISFNRAKENSVVYEQLPEGFDAKQLQTQHPNSNVQTMVDFLANRCAASMGLSKVFATGNPEDTNWRANQLFTWPTVQEFQHDLEQVADWLFNCFVKWSVKNGDVKGYVADDIMDYVDWTWAHIDDMDEVAHQTGIRLALENGTKTYKEIIGQDWKEQLAQTAYEHQWMTSHGLTHPADLMVSGGQTQASKTAVETVVEERTEEPA
jgi:capsid protein